MKNMDVVCTRIPPVMKTYIRSSTTTEEGCQGQLR